MSMNSGWKAGDARPRPVIGGGEVMVRQAFKDETDINKLLARYASTGTLPLRTKVPVFADVAIGMDLKEAMDHVAELKSRFKDLPPEAQDLYRQDPRAFMAAVGEAKGVDDFVALGLVKKPKVEEPAPKPAPEPVAAPE